MKVMMKELGEIITGNTPSKKTEEFWNSEDICFIKPDIIADNGINEIVDSNEYISEDARKKARVVGKNSIFITCIGNIGKLGIASDGEYAFNQQINAIIPNDRVQPKYLAYNLLFNKARLVAMANAPVVPIINKSQFGEFTVNIETDIDRQNETVDVLDKLTQIIQQRNKEISALDELIKARFVEMFGDINLNDKKWNHEPLGKLCTIVRGGSPRPIDQFLGGDVPWIKIGDATDGDNVYLTSTKEHIIQEGVKKSRLVKAGSLIFANCGVSLGFARILTFDGCIHDGWLAMEDIDARLDKVFLLQSLNQMTEHFRSIAPAGTQPNLNTAIMKCYQQIMPPIELQREFIRFAKQVDKSKAAVQKALDETQLLFDSLMQEYFG